MRRTLFLIFAAVVCCSSAAIACGDKFLLVGRGASYRGRYVAIHPAKILLFGPKSAGDGEVDVRRILERAGHNVDYAADEAQFQAAMRAKKYDVVISPLDELQKTEGRVHSVSSSALVLPILFASNDAEVRQAEKQYECIARSSTRQRTFLGVLDDAMGIRLKGQPIACPWSNGS